MTKRLSQLEQERQVRERRLARPYPDDWSEWDTKAALMAAEEFEQKAREALKRRRVDVGWSRNCSMLLLKHGKKPG
jgi:hypothetical protein